METNLNLVQEKIIKYLTSSLLFTCQNCLDYKYNGSEAFYDHKEVSNKTFDFIVNTLTNITDIFKYDDEKKAEIVAELNNERFVYGKVILDYYVSYFNLEFINKLFISSKYVNQLDASLKEKIITVNQHIRENADNVFIEYMPHLLSKINENDFNKVATTISHEYERFTFEHITNIYKYYSKYFSKENLTRISTSTLEDKFSFSTLFDNNVSIIPETTEKVEKVFEDTQREVMDAISDLTLLYESLKDLNVLIGFIVDENVIFGNQLVVKDIYYTFKSLIKEDESLLLDSLFETLDNTIFTLVEESVDFSEKIKAIIKQNPSNESLFSLLNVLDILEAVYSDDVFDYFVSDLFFEQYLSN